MGSGGPLDGIWWSDVRSNFKCLLNILTVDQVKVDDPQELILTQQARAVIIEAVQSGKYADREDNSEPPFMMPSPEPESYSRVRNP